MVFLGGMVSQGLKDQLDPLDLKDPKWRGYLHTVGKELLSRNTGHRVTLLRHHRRNVLDPNWRWSQPPVHASGPRVQHHPHIQRWSARTCLCLWYGV